MVRNNNNNYRNPIRTTLLPSHRILYITIRKLAQRHAVREEADRWRWWCGRGGVAQDDKRLKTYHGISYIYKQRKCICIMYWIGRKVDGILARDDLETTGGAVSFSSRGVSVTIVIRIVGVSGVFKAHERRTRLGATYCSFIIVVVVVVLVIILLY